MSASAVPKPERVNQVWLEEAMDSHEKFLRGIPGGKRLSVSFKDARHLDFSGRNLATADMVAAELSHAVFEGACLARSNLFGANLESAQMRECDLTRADLRGVTLNGANLECANLHEADIRNGFILFRDKNGNLIPMRDGAAEISDVNLSGADLSGAKLGRVIGPRTNLSNANFKNAKLVAANLADSDVRGAIFTGADLTDADMSGCVFQGANLSGAILYNTNLDGADLTAAHFLSDDLKYAHTTNLRLPRSLASLDKTISGDHRRPYPVDRQPGAKRSPGGPLPHRPPACGPIRRGPAGRGAFARQSVVFQAPRRAFRDGKFRQRVGHRR